MKGLELAREFYNQFGKSMLEQDFKDILPFLAVGFVGSGSDRYGFDDDISKDHDYEAGFTIFLPNEDKVNRKQEFALERAYIKLPKEFLGIKRNVLSPVGGNRNGPLRTADFYLGKVGNSKGELTVNEWLTIPDYALFEATNGEVFFDGLGEFTKIRNYLSNMPEDIRLKRLAGNTLIMAQSGQYNFSRMVNRGEKQGATLAINEFVIATLKVVFLLNRKYCPYYKWSFRALKELKEKAIYEKLSYIVLTENESEENLKKKADLIEEVCSLVEEKLQKQNLTEAVCGDMEKHAYSVNDKISDSNIRNLNILISI